MENLFKDDDSIKFVEKYAAYPEDLALRVYTSRLIGRNSSLVLHGGGNTSVKIKIKNIVGEENHVVFVKGSGADLSTIEPKEFAGLNINPVRKLRSLKRLSDDQMVNQQKIHKIDATAPDPSVEALCHAFLPHKYIDHTHADSILVLTNQKNGPDIIKEALGKRVVVLDYIISGLPLAKAMVTSYEKNPDIDAIIIINHGIFTFARDAKGSYGKMIHYVDRADAYIKKLTRDKHLVSLCCNRTSQKKIKLPVSHYLQVIRGACAHRISEERLRRFYVETRSTPEMVKISLSKEALFICSSGALTPDHVIRTKNRMVYIDCIPENEDGLKTIVKTRVDAFKSDYHDYFQHQIKNQDKKQFSGQKELDPYPRLFLIAGLGLVAIGFTRKDALIAADIGEHTIRAKLLARVLNNYCDISDDHIFAMEYWSLQQKKLDKTEAFSLNGQVAVVTGGGGAIGFGIADRLLAAGACVVISDIDSLRLEKIRKILAEKYNRDRIETCFFDVTDYMAVKKGFDEISRRFGGIDIIVPNAGIAHVARIEDLEPDKFDQVVAVNLKGTFNTIKASIPVFKRQNTGGNIVLISSKNVFDPGAAFGAYSASKAGAHQISKIAALELAETGVRVNMINPDAVFGDSRISSKLWDLIGPDRMKSRGLDAEGLQEYYRTRNLLKQRVLAKHVGNAVVFFAGEQIPTTGATLPVDGGIPAAFPR